jgi:hypothetical protein
MQLQSILNRVQKYNSFVYEGVERGGGREGAESEQLSFAVFAVLRGSSHKSSVSVVRKL